MSERFMISTVIYQDWDEFVIDSVWFRPDLAQQRADELNAKAHPGSAHWDIDEVELGDPDER